MRRDVDRKRALRIALLAVVLVSTLTVGARTQFLSPQPAENVRSPGGISHSELQGSTLISGPRLLVVDRSGTVVLAADDHGYYHDVDVVADTRATVVYTAVTTRPFHPHCDGVRYPFGRCARQVVEVLNLTTGQRDTVLSRVTPTKRNAEWHAVDRVDDGEYLVADTHRNRVFLYNDTTGLVTWEWTAQESFGLHSGGPYPTDWTHINDVELLPTGEVMVSVRNLDQVVFIDKTTGDVTRTLGREDAHWVLEEQHNPDVLGRGGGAAVLVADSGNNRVVEYERANGTWSPSWTWTDGRLRFPRDADRLPNGHTLIVDSSGNRVLEVDQSGAVVWTYRPAGWMYDAERLGTGSGSTAGPTASEADLTSVDRETRFGGRWGDAGGLAESIPTDVLNVVAFFISPWFTPFDAVLTLAALIGFFFWLALELYWSPYTVRSPITRR